MVFWGSSSRGGGAALNFDVISGRGPATAGFEAFFMLKLNLLVLGVWDCDPVAGGRLGGGIRSSLDGSGLLVSSTCRSFEGRKGLSLSSIWESPLSCAGST